MKVFLPFKKESNPYLDEIIRYSSHDFIYGDFTNEVTGCDIINIHWPEALFNWQEPKPDNLKKLKKVIKIWKQSAILVYTKHDYQRNKGTTELFTELFRLIEKEADVFIHLGEYSLNLYELKYPKAIHKLVNHPLYSRTFENYRLEKIDARNKLDIDPEAFVMVVPGNIRSFEERDLVLKAFKDLEVKNKVLIATNMRSEIRYNFRGRVKMKKIFDVRNYVVEKFKNKHKPPKYLFSYDPIDSDELALRVEAADVVFVPRVDILNSGIPYLGLTFNKIVLGPAIGNIKEILEYLKFPSFDPANKKSVNEALKNARTLSQNKYFPEDELLLKYKPEYVANLLDSIFVDLKA